jgi:NADH:ubiquinone oxidoreductase subunit 5 (subunit L)/multisubunit Na+/H+ antiporter MnhA subunit/multisubunit Na+/H+ antiporter MnhB subunit
MDVGLIILAPFILAILVPVIAERLPKKAVAWLLAGIVALFLLGVVVYVPRVQGGAAIAISIPWVPSLGLSFAIYLDSLSILFGLLVTGIGSLIVLFAGYYFDTSAEANRFYRLLFIFMGGMLGLIFSGNLLTLFIGWEITSVTSFFLISFNGRDPEARRSASQALIVTAGGGLALLLGLILLGTAGGSFELASLLSKGDLFREHPWYSAIAILLFIGCFTKSAQWPFHFWLPGAMTAPTPASAYLHSATMVKAGVYLLLRLSPIMADTALWEGALIGFGLITMLTGALLALRNTDLKACLAYSTVSQLGALVALIGLPHGEGLLAALIGVLGHALYKGALFLIAGTVDHATGTRDIRKLGDLRAEMPAVAWVTVIATLSMAGVPPLLGFVAKEGLVEAFLHGVTGPGGWAAVCVVGFSALLTVTMAIMLAWDVFFRRPLLTGAVDHHAESGGASPEGTAEGAAHSTFHAPGFGLVLAPGVLAALSLILPLGLVPLVGPLVGPYLGGAKLALWHGFNAAFLVSLIALSGGLAVFLTRSRWQAWAGPTLPRGQTVYQQAVRGVEWFADQLLRSQGGNIRYYLAAILGAVILLMATAGLTNHLGNFGPGILLTSSADLLQIVLLCLTIVATFFSILFRRHLVAALALGVSGYSVGGLFLLTPAPDVALVQFLVETIGTVLVMIMLGKISAQERQHVINNLWRQTRGGLLRDILISVLVGLGVGLFSLSALLNRPTRASITTWHLENTYTRLGISDVVAGIVTDFRGMDTVIEITVFGMAALGMLTLLSTPEPGRTVQFNAGRLLQQLRARGIIPQIETFAEKEAVDPGLQREIAALLEKRGGSPVATPLTRIGALFVLPAALLIAVAHLLYGGDAPGDGFTAGVVTGLGVALWYVVFGYNGAKRRLWWLHPQRLIGIGIGLAVLNAAAPLVFGEPFLTTTQFKGLDLPAGIHFASTTIFEFSIFLTVLGGSSIILETIAHPQEVEAL